MNAIVSSWMLGTGAESRYSLHADVSSNDVAPTSMLYLQCFGLGSVCLRSRIDAFIRLRMLVLVVLVC